MLYYKQLCYTVIQLSFKDFPKLLYWYYCISATDQRPPLEHYEINLSANLISFDSTQDNFSYSFQIVFAIGAYVGNYFVMQSGRFIFG